MNKSESIKELLKAVSVFQGELENVEKGKEGHGYKYATLGACIDAAKPILAKNGLSVIQFLGSDDNSNTTIETILGHSSGEYMTESCIIPIAKLAGGGANNPAQVLGASVTYFRRYQYAAVLGLAQEDDDAGSATKGTAQHNETDWYNSFEIDKQSMIDALSNGETNDSIIKSLQGSGYAINKKVRQQIMELKA